MANTNWAAGHLPAATAKPELPWTVFRANFPFSVGCELGTVRAPTKDAALQLAVEQFGKDVVVGRSTTAAAIRSES